MLFRKRRKQVQVPQRTDEVDELKARMRRVEADVARIRARQAREEKR